MDFEKFKEQFHPSINISDIQYDLEGNLIKEWSRIKEAADNLECDSSGISACCRNKCKSIKGFIWKYKQN